MFDFIKEIYFEASGFDTELLQKERKNKRLKREKNIQKILKILFVIALISMIIGGVLIAKLGHNNGDFLMFVKFIIISFLSSLTLVFLLLKKRLFMIISIILLVLLSLFI